MKALVATEFGPSPKMIIEERPAFEPKAGYSIVKMHAATVNPLSNQIRTGLVPAATAPLVLSNDGSGIVEQSERFSAGTRVAIYGGGTLGITEDGLQQQWVLVADQALVELPENISLDEGAAMPINYLSAFQAINRVGQMQPGQTALISGASGSVGGALIQLVAAFGGRPVAVVSSTAKVARAKAAGAVQVIDLSVDDLRQRVLELTAGQGADIAFDPVGGALMGQLLSAVKTRGAVVSIGFAGGTEATVDVMDIVVYEKQILGFDAHLETDQDVDVALTSIMQLAAQGLLKPCIDSIYPLADYDQAYQHLISRQAMGTILLRLSDD